MKKILVPTDFFEKSHYAPYLACQMARKNGARIKLIIVTPKRRITECFE